jgi:phosphate transport system substrate-binding protein
MIPALHELAAAFQLQNPSVLVEVQGSDTANGWEDLRGGRADIAAVSWWEESTPAPEGYHLVPVARDAIAVVVHPSNPITNLTALQLRALFAGEILDWPALGGVEGEPMIVSREEGSGTRAAFEFRIMGERRVTLNAVVMPTTQAVVDYVAAHRLAVGYVTSDSVDRRVSVVPIEGLAPNSQTVAAGYHLVRTLYLATHAPPLHPVQAFLDFANSSAGLEGWGKHFTPIR